MDQDVNLLSQASQSIQQGLDLIQFKRIMFILIGLQFYLGR